MRINGKVSIVLGQGVRERRNWINVGMTMGAALAFASSLLPISSLHSAHAENTDPMAPPAAPPGVQWHIQRFDVPLPHEACVALYRARPELAGEPCTHPVVFGYTDSFSQGSPGSVLKIHHLSPLSVARLIHRAHGRRLHPRPSPMCVPDPAGVCATPYSFDTYK